MRDTVKFALQSLARTRGHDICLVLAIRMTVSTYVTSSEAAPEACSPELFIAKVRVKVRSSTRAALQSLAPKSSSHEADLVFDWFMRSRCQRSSLRAWLTALQFLAQKRGSWDEAGGTNEGLKARTTIFSVGKDLKTQG